MGTLIFQEQKQNTVSGSKCIWTDVVTGVYTQGSVLGPVFFLIYINDDLPNMLSNPCLLFADDTKICSHIRNEDDISTAAGH